MTFDGAPLLQPIGSRDWVLMAPLVYYTVDWAIEVPSGFLTDLASIPRVFWPLVPVNGRHRAAAILHDYLYVTQPCTRAEADALFLEAMHAGGVRWSVLGAFAVAVVAPPLVLTEAWYVVDAVAPLNVKLMVVCVEVIAASTTLSASPTEAL